MMSAWWARAAALLLALGAAWSLGFALFLAAAHETQPLPRRADGIVVLTGGADRVSAGLHLLADERAPVLLISGVARRSDLPAIAYGLGLDTHPLAPRVTLGHAARSTLGNAAEIAGWAQRIGARSLIVVTAGYHMARALIEIGRALPDVQLYPAPVQPPALRRGEDPAILRLLAGEFDKYLAVRAGLDRVLARRGA